MHADWRGIDDGVEEFMSEAGPGNGFATDGARERHRFEFPARENRNGGSGLGEREGDGAGDSAGTEDEHAAAAKRHAPPECTQDADIVGVVSVKFSTTANHNSVDGADGSCQRITIIEVPQNALFVRQSDAEAGDAERCNGAEKIVEIVDQERQVHCVHFARLESGVVKLRRERMGDGIANHAIDPRATGDLAGAIQSQHFRERDLAWGRGVFDRRISERAALGMRQDAQGHGDLAHGHCNEVAASAREAEEAQRGGNGIAMRGDFYRSGARVQEPPDDPLRVGGHGAEEVCRDDLAAFAEKDVEQLRRALRGGFNFEVVPVAARAERLR